jgi:hypothetical protein
MGAKPGHIHTNQKKRNLYLRIIGKYPQTTNSNFLFADVSLIKFDACLKLLATYTLETIGIQPEDPIVEEN